MPDTRGACTSAFRAIARVAPHIQAPASAPRIEVEMQVATQCCLGSVESVCSLTPQLPAVVDRQNDALPSFPVRGHLITEFYY